MSTQAILLAATDLLMKARMTTIRGPVAQSVGGSTRTADMIRIDSRASYWSVAQLVTVCDLRTRKRSSCKRLMTCPPLPHRLSTQGQVSH